MSGLRLTLLEITLLTLTPITHPTMKRKRVGVSSDGLPPKRAAKISKEGSPAKVCPLIKVLAQYGLLSCLTSYLVPRDLYALARTSKAAFRAIFPRPESRISLLKKTLCEGKGVAIRARHHKKSPFFYTFGCIESVKCGTEDKHIEVQPCVRCNTNTCDECRIHCVYQSIRQPVDEPDELDAFSGFVLLNGLEMGILSDAHLDYESSPWPTLGNHHDQGFLDIPLTSSVFAAPVEITELINTDLGSRPLTTTYSSGTPHPSPVIKAFWEITEQRKRSICLSCFEEKQHQGQVSRETCHCTLQGRFLDRWLCLGCFQQEEEEVKSSTLGVCGMTPTTCTCGTAFSESTIQTICLWCYGAASNH